MVNRGDAIGWDEWRDLPIELQMYVAFFFVLGAPTTYAVLPQGVGVSP